MTISDGIMIVAVLLSPLLAVQVQKWIERVRDVRQRKVRVFQTLMATRAARVSLDHVQALNMIDLEFCGRCLRGIRWQSNREKAVVQAWSVYRDRLNDQANFKDETGFKRREAAFVDLLFAMSCDLGYDFDKVYLERSVYAPVAHGDLEWDQYTVRKGLSEVLTGRRPIAIAAWGSDTSRPATPEVSSANQGQTGKSVADAQQPQSS